MVEVFKKRPTIGFFVNDGDYSEPLCRGVFDAEAVYDVNLIVFPADKVLYQEKEPKKEVKNFGGIT